MVKTIKKSSIILIREVFSVVFLDSLAIHLVTNASLKKIDLERFFTAERNLRLVFDDDDNLSTNTLYGVIKLETELQLINFTRNCLLARN